MPALRNEAFTVPAVARVTFEANHGRVSELAANRYVSLLRCCFLLERDSRSERQFPLDALARKTLPGYLDERRTETAGSGGMVLILDQFEESHHRSDRCGGQKEFFAQLSAAAQPVPVGAARCAKSTWRGSILIEA